MISRVALEPYLVCVFLVGVICFVVGERMGDRRLSRTGRVMGVAVVAAIGLMSFLAWRAQG